MGEPLSLTIEAPATLEDELVALLWAHGGEGSWSEELDGGRVRIHGFMDDGCDGEELRRAFAIAPEVSVSALTPVEATDWAAAWRRASGPIEVGTRFVVDPREPGEAGEPLDAGDRILLRLPVRTAFGSGSHASTRLAVELIERSTVEGLAVLDVGTGSGILAFAALALGARKAVALDVDSAAAMLVPHSSSLNALRPTVFVGTTAALDDDARFDLALVNVVPSEIVGDLPRLAALLSDSGQAIFSGILASEAGHALEALAETGFRERERTTDGEWIAFLCHRAGTSEMTAERRLSSE